MEDGTRVLRVVRAYLRGYYDVCELVVHEVSEWKEGLHREPEGEQKLELPGPGDSELVTHREVKASIFLKWWQSIGMHNN